MATTLRERAQANRPMAASYWVSDWTRDDDWQRGLTLARQQARAHGRRALVTLQPGLTSGLYLNLYMERPRSDGDRR